jgi:hypothetical protein
MKNPTSFDNEEKISSTNDKSTLNGDIGNIRKTCNCENKDISMESMSFIYAIGKIEPRFPSQDIEKEFVQATARTDTSGQTDSQSMNSILSDKSNRYLARQLCWILKIEGIETYLLQPRNSADLDMLIESLRPVKRR